MVRLKARGIDSRPFFHPIHTMPPYATGAALPVAERLAHEGINLPSAVTLREADIERIARAMREAAQ
jgi:perosamine synthetase